MLIWIFCAVSGLMNGYVVARTTGMIKRIGMFVCLTATAVITASLLMRFLHQPAPEEVSASASHGAPMAAVAYMLFTLVVCIFATGAFIFTCQARK
ncbi:hypothetical protein HHX48_12150 [Salinimonas sp. HHU 13199]|uniref:Uncharacterized protein n=1 Tax=Salinimonas profundi TaxID=2729140 RepID=A0ABR8LQV6_9ALTE|nr:hypothetical protein [Salinimonas profundi]MBD3586490.1 hypothetical protein [Salinimonas profundi]